LVVDLPAAYPLFQEINQVGLIVGPFFGLNEGEEQGSWIDDFCLSAFEPIPTGLLRVQGWRIYK
jgi:hypothetical protein